MTVTSKQQALDLFESHRRDLLVQLRLKANQLWDSNGHRPITIEDVRPLIDIPDYINPTFLGAVFNRGDWMAVGYVQAKRPEAHGRPIRQFARKW